MSGGPAKKGLPREQFIAFLRLEIERMQTAGTDPEMVGVYSKLLKIYESEDDPGFYVDLYYRYYKEGLMPHRAAALAALYAFVVTPTKHPLEAIFEDNTDIAIPYDQCGMARIPAWILQGLFEGAHNYLTHTSRTLNEAFQITGGKRGAAKLDAPLRDLSTTEHILIVKFEQIQSGKKPNTSSAASELEGWVTSETGSDQTAGYNERSSRNAYNRICRIFGW